MSKGLEALKDIKGKYENDNGLQRRLSIIERELKALAIIKDKGVDVGWLMKTQTLSEYNNIVGTVSHEALSQEEYELLKEVLL